MTAICTVSGPLIDPTGALLINTPVTFVRVQEVGGTGTATVIGRDVTTTSDALGLIEVDLLAGQYVAQVIGSRGMFNFGVGVPDAAAADLHECIEQVPAITPDLVAQTVAARDEARDWATKAEDSPVTTGLFSAFHWARKAWAWAQAAAASAINAALYDPTLRYPSVSMMLASTRSAAGVGTVWQAAHHQYLEAASSASDHHLTTAGGVKLYVRPSSMGYDVQAFGAKGDGVTDDSAAFLKAAGIGTYVAFVVPEASYLCNSTIPLQSGQTWTVCGAEIFHTVDDRAIFRADSIRDWAILGSLRLRGTLSTEADVPADIGLYITNGKRYKLQGVEATAFKGRGFFVDGITTGGDARRGDRGQISDCSAHQNTIGIEFGPGAGAEYTTVSNFTASGNTLGVLVDAGNVTFLGGNIVDNKDGIFLAGVGNNNCHGIFNGVNINHNLQSNVKAENVQRGHTFTGCHIYGNAAGSQGNIWLINSRGIRFSGGDIDAWIYNDLGANTRAGINRVLGVRFPTNNTGGTNNTTLQSNDGGLVNLEVLDCWTNSGAASLNDPAPVYVRSTRGGSTQALTSNTQTVVVFNSKTGDKKGILNTSTGQVTAPVSGIYRVFVSVLIGGSGLSNCFGHVRVDGVNFCPLVGGVFTFTGGTANGAGIIEGSVDVVLTAGQVLDISVQITGTSPAIQANVTRLHVELLR